jgi:hypothetical protein
MLCGQIERALVKQEKQMAFAMIDLRGISERVTLGIAPIQEGFAFIWSFWKGHDQLAGALALPGFSG